jgi:hypothetical protein
LWLFASCAIYVTIKEIDPDEGDEVEGNHSELEVIHKQQGSGITVAETKRASAKRDEIATAMWDDYRARGRQI